MVAHVDYIMDSLWGPQGAKTEEVSEGKVVLKR